MITAVLSVRLTHAKHVIINSTTSHLGLPGHIYTMNTTIMSFVVVGVIGLLLVKGLGFSDKSMHDLGALIC